MDTFKQGAIAYVKKTMECPGYRDYIVEHLESENLYDAIESYKHEVTKSIPQKSPLSLCKYLLKTAQK